MVCGCSTANALGAESLSSLQSARVIVECLDHTPTQEGWTASQVHMEEACALRRFDCIEEVHERGKSLRESLTEVLLVPVLYAIFVFALKVVKWEAKGELTPSGLRSGGEGWLTRATCQGYVVEQAKTMELQSLQVISSAIAPVVMVSAAGLLFMGVQAKNLHLSDRMRALMVEYRTLGTAPVHQERREQIVAQLVLFKKRIRLSQRALEFLYLAVFCFVMTSLFLASESFMAPLVTPAVTAAIFVLGVSFLLLALLFEFLELRTGLKTIGIEIAEVFRPR